MITWMKNMPLWNFWDLQYVGLMVMDIEILSCLLSIAAVGGNEVA
jgi:hypothetical protein